MTLRVALRRGTLAAVLIAGRLPVLHAATGTDVVAGAAGYRWRDSNDGAAADARGFDAGYASLTMVDDAAPRPVTLPFPFPFYGWPRSTLYISDNGWLGFAGPDASPYPTPSLTLPDAVAPNALIAACWDQLLVNDAAAGLRIQHGLAAGGQAYLVDVVATHVPSVSELAFRVYLHRTGLIRIQYSRVTSFSGPSVGLENDGGIDGCRVASGGLTAAGVAGSVPAGYVIEFEPPSILETQSAGVVPVACGSTSTLALPGNGPAFVGAYGCSGPGNDARERVSSFSVARPSVVRLSATTITARNLRMYVLGSCNERDCIAGPATNATLVLGPGTYFVAVDAPTTADEGTYALSVTCSPLATTTSCGGSVSGTTAAGRSLFAGYPCAPGVNLVGRESYFQIDVAAPTNLRAQLSGLSANLDLLILAVHPGPLEASDCIAWGDGLAAAFDVQPGTYLVIVDGVSGASGAFTLEIDCRIDLACDSPAGRIDFGSARSQSVSGDTRLGESDVATYACDPATSYAASELVYELILPQPGHVLAVQTGGVSGLSFFILDECNEGACLGMSCGGVLAAGTHYLVVDGAAGAAGPFDLLVAYEEPFNRWTTCEPPFGMTQPTDRVNDVWAWDDAAYCWSDPASYNYPTGCTFAMYSIVQCGTAMHLPLYDVESGHVRVFDVFRGEYVSLTAVSTGGWAMSGTDIAWEDCTGADPRWNDQTTDISFSDPDGLCGLFRIEFPLHSGAQWELLANCTGAHVGQFNIHDSLCGALEEYAPLPNLSLTAASAVADCPDVTITYTVRNDGCAPAHDVPVRLLDAGVEIATDLLPEAPYGETTTRTFSARFPGPTRSVTLVIDPDDVIVECSETGGVACNPIAGRESRPLSGCSPGSCVIETRATLAPPLACAGDPLVVDASASTSTNCAGGALEFQLGDPSGILVPWTASALFPAQHPGETTEYLVEARCVALPACAGAVPITADIERPPDLDPASVVAQDPSSCNLGLRVSWAPATFFGPTRTGFYNVYRSTSSCADALARPPLAQGLVALAFSDTSTVDGPAYFYVVEAEDATPAAACALRGPVTRGPATRVEASSGTCAAVTDSASPRPELLPRVGGTLRVGGSAPGGGRRYGQTFVDLRWTSDRPLNPFGGEHFHVLRSERPQDIVSLMTPEPPVLVATTVRDSDADDRVGNAGLHVWHYLVHVSDACENDTRGLDNP